MRATVPSKSAAPATAGGAVVVVLQGRGGDAEPDEHDVPGGGRTGARGVRIERLAEREVRLPEPRDPQRVVGCRARSSADRSGWKWVPPDPTGRETEPGEPRGDEVGRDPVPAGCPSAGPAGCRRRGTGDVRLQVAGPDRFAPRGRGRILRHPPPPPPESRWSPPPTPSAHVIPPHCTRAAGRYRSRRRRLGCTSKSEAPTAGTGLRGIPGAKARDKARSGEPRYGNGTEIADLTAPGAVISQI